MVDAILSTPLNDIENIVHAAAVDFTQAKFKMLFKNKGATDDPTKYRCLDMLNHAYKALSQCLLVRIEQETKSYLSEWQAGFIDYSE